MVRCREFLFRHGHFLFLLDVIKKEVNKLLEDLKGPIDNLEERIYGMRDSL